MATVSILHPPVTSDSMASRRLPLASVPHGVNSPYRTKRSRTQTGDQRDLINGQPPAKKLIIEVPHGQEENFDPRRTNGLTEQQSKLEEPFDIKRSNNAVPTALEKKLAAAREPKLEPKPVPQPKNERLQKVNGDNMENIRQWQKHYRRQFPQFVFYFDTIPDDVRVKVMRQIWTLGAREEKFFSKAVTHVVTTRSIPPDHGAHASNDDAKDAQARTVKPSTLAQDQRKTTSLLDAHLQRRTLTSVAPNQLTLDNRKLQVHSSDILLRARELGIKIWALEKLQRVLSTILDTEIADNGTAQEPRAHVTNGRSLTRPAENANLEQLLRNEKVNGPADRDMTVTAQDMVALKGFYIYIHDMDEKTKPVMVRDYAKVKEKGEWKWPQFRLSAAGRCPFVEDPHYEKKLEQQDRERLAKEQADIERANRTRKMTAATQNLSQPLPQSLAERNSNLRRSPRKHTQEFDVNGIAKPADPSKGHPLNRQSSIDVTPAYFGSTQVKLRGPPRMVGGEPVASGVQPSNITSAIRSQVVSSTAISSTAPGMNRRIGDTKEVSMLKRKVLERGQSNLSNASSLANDMRAVINADSSRPVRAAKRKAQETLGVVAEDDEADGSGARPRTTSAKRKKTEKEAKPGYCENCHDKFEDFDEHVMSRKHRKYALTPDNWAELDNLLSLLKRPHKVV